MLVSRDLSVVARFSRLSVFLMLFLAATISSLAVYALTQVCLYALPGFPGSGVHVLPVCMPVLFFPVSVWTSLLRAALSMWCY